MPGEAVPDVGGWGMGSTGVKYGKVCSQVMIKDGINLLMTPAIYLLSVYHLCTYHLSITCMSDIDLFFTNLYIFHLSFNFVILRQGLTM